MTTDDIRCIRLYRQHLTSPTDKITAARDLLGVQAQFTVNALHALRLRTQQVLTEETWGEGLCKNWTVRGTVHVFAQEDLGLFKYNPALYRNADFRGYHYRDGTWALTSERQCFWSEKILSYIDAGICTRDALKEACTGDGMTAAETESMFDAWGGGMRDLCERGFLNYIVQEKKAFARCPDFSPMGEENALAEMVRRYFLHFGPATLRDAAYYFGMPQARLKPVMQRLPLTEYPVEGAVYYDPGTPQTDYPDIPRCILLAGFDQLMLGYRKEDSLFLPREHLRGIFNLAGIVMPAILLDGRVCGKWKCRGGKLTATLFVSVSAAQREIIAAQAQRYFGPLSKAEFVF